MTEKKEEKFKDKNEEAMSKKIKLFEHHYARRKKDGTFYKNRREMKENYDKSNIPYPIAPFIHFDYCHNIFMNHINNCFFFAGPLSLISAYALNKDVRMKGFKAKNFVYYISHYIMVNIVCMSLFTLDCLLFCDYCKPWSSIYNEENDSEYFKKTIMPKLNSQKSSYEFQLERTKTRGLRDDEL